MRVRAWLCVCVVVSLSALATGASAQSRRAFAIGDPVLTDIWVDPVRGNDDQSGASRDTAVRTVDRAWRLVPVNTPATPFTTRGYRIRLVGGTYEESVLPNYWDERYGSFAAPIIIEAADGPRTVVLQGDINMANVAYVYLLNLDIVPEPAGDAFHCEACDHILVRNARMSGGTWSRTSPSNALAHETLKVNQSTHVYVEDSVIRGAGDNALDFVGVQYGHIVRSTIGNANDWCGYVKGGSAYLVIEANTFEDCGTGGFTVGQGTGFQFMTSPWLHYEAYGISVINNLVRQVDGAGLGVNGGYNVLFAWNTIVGSGSRSHVFEAVFGGRSCDGPSGAPDRVRCSSYLASGGWGTTRVDDGTNYARIPNRHVYVVNNLFYNPDGTASQYQHFAIARAYSGESQAGTNAPSPALADDDLRIAGNVIWNGTPSHSLGVGGEDAGCGDTHPTCSAAVLLRDNAINTVRPVFANEAGGDYRVAAGLLPVPAAVPAFVWSDRPSAPAVPAGVTADPILFDYAGAVRQGSDHAGAFVPVRPSAVGSPSTLRFAATKAGAAGAIVSVTGPQVVTVTQTGGTAAAWTATAVEAWIRIEGGAGVGAGQFTVEIVNPGNAIGASTSLSGTVTITSTTLSSVTSVAVELSIQQAVGTTTGPTGQVDTPAQSATGLQGAIAMTGWVVDDVGIQHVRIYRQCLSFEPQVGQLGSPCQTVLGNSLVFVGTASVISGARPDVEALFPTLPANNSAGWGFLILSNLLPNIPASNANGGGVGTFQLYAIATDVEGNQKLLGRSYTDTAPQPTTVTVANDTIAKPFGAIDTPAQGATVSGTLNNFGWVLTPDSNTVADGTDILMPTTGTTIAVIVDGASVGTATYNLCRGTVGNPVPSGTLCDDDVSGIFRAAGVYRNLDAARGPIGLRTINTASLSNGLHTIQWGATDSASRGEGIGSRYFTVLNSAGDASELRDSGTSELRHSGTSEPRDSGTSTPLFGRTGFDLARAFVALGEIDGVPTIRVPEVGRVELEIPGAKHVALLANGEARSAPVGLSIDADAGMVRWSVGPGYLGTYRLSIEREDDQVLVDVTVAPMALVDEPLRMHLDRAQVEGPGLSSSTWLGAGERFVRVEGWALDPQAETGSGIGAVHVWARRRGSEVPEFRGAEVPESRGPEVPKFRSAEVPVFLGVADLGVAQPDVAAAHGARFPQAGFSFQGVLPEVGEWEVTAYVWNVRTQRFEDARTIIVIAR